MGGRQQPVDRNLGCHSEAKGRGISFLGRVQHSQNVIPSLVPRDRRRLVLHYVQDKLPRDDRMRLAGFVEELGYGG